VRRARHFSAHEPVLVLCLSSTCVPWPGAHGPGASCVGLLLVRPAGSGEREKPLGWSAALLVQGAHASRSASHFSGRLPWGQH